MSKKVEIVYGRSDVELMKKVNNYLSNHSDLSPRVVNMTSTPRGGGSIQFHCMIEYNV